MITPELIAEHAQWAYANFLVALAINVALTVLANLISGPRKIEGPRADLSRPQTADPGVVIPEIEGTGQMVAQFIWADSTGVNGGPTHEIRDTTTSGNLFTGKTKTTTYRYYSTFAVALCRTEHLPGGKIKGFRKIWANDKVLYDAEDVSTSSAQLANAALTADRDVLFGDTLVTQRTFFFTGEETQEPAAVITTIEGDAPAYRGLAYILFQGLNTTEWGGVVPSIRAEVVADGEDSDTTFTSFAPARYASPDTWYVKRSGFWAGPGFTEEWVNDNPAGEPFSTQSQALSASAPSDPGDEPIASNVEQYASGTQLQYHSYFYNGAGVTYDECIVFDFQIWSDKLDNVWYCGDTGAMIGIKVNDGDDPPVGGWDYTSTFQTGTGKRVFAWKTTNIVGEASKTCDYTCPIGDPREAGQPTMLPENPLFCIDYKGDISLNGGKTSVSGSYKALRRESTSTLSIDSPFNSYNPITEPEEPRTISAKGPVLKSDDPNYNNQSWWEEQAAIAGIRGEYGTDYPVTISDVCGSSIEATSLAPNTILLKNIITRDVLRVEPTLTESDLEFVGLDTYTVDGRVITEMASPADRLAEVEEVFKVDCVPVDGKLRFVRRASAPEVAVDFSEFGAFIPGSQPPKPLDETRPNNVELPRFTNLIYYGIDVHAQDKQTAERTTVTAVGERTVNSAFTFDAQQAKDVVEVIHQAQWAELYGRVKFTLSMAHSDIIPSDWITTSDGNRDIKIRVTYQKVVSNGLIEFEGIVDRKENYTPGAFGIAEQLAAGLSALGIPGPTLLRLLNLPNLEDGDDVPGHYVAVSYLLSDWQGTTLQESFDGSTWKKVRNIEEAVILGSLLTDMSASNGYTLDEDGSIDVGISTDQEPESLTMREFLNGEVPVIIGEELLLYRDAVEVSAGKWRLSYLLRAWRSTEGHDHSAGDEVIIGRPVFIPSEDWAIGQDKYYRAVSFGVDPDSVYEPTFTNSGESVDEFGVVDIQSSRDASDNITVTFRAQKRLGMGFNQFRHSRYFERYEMDVLDGSDVVRTIESTSEEFSYTSAQQTTDFGADQSAVDVIIYTVNDYGRGDATEATV